MTQKQIPFIDYVIGIFGENYAGYILMLTANITYPLLFLYVNEHHFSFVENLMSRCWVMLIFNALLCRWYEYPMDFKSSTGFKLLNWRNFLMIIYSYVFAFAQFYLPLPIIFTVNSSGPLFVYVADYFTYGIKITKSQLIGLIVGIFGLLMVINGKFLIYYIYPSFSKFSLFENYQDASISMILGICFLFILTCSGWGYAASITKEIPFNSLQISVHWSILCLLISPIIYIYIQNPVDPITMLWSLLYTGLVGAIGQFFFIAGLQIAKSTGSGAIIGFISVIIGYFVSIFRYNEEINPLCVIGSLLVLYGIYKAIFSKS